MKKINLLPWRYTLRKQKQLKAISFFLLVIIFYLLILIFLDKLLDSYVKNMALYRDQEAIKWIHLQSEPIVE